METLPSCPHCGHPGPDVQAVPSAWRCPECRQVVRLEQAPSVLGGPLLPGAGPYSGLRKSRSIWREQLKFFAFFVPLVALATGIIFLIILWVQSVKPE